MEDNPRRRLRVSLLALAVVTVAAFAASSSGAAHGRYTIAYVADGTPSLRDHAVARGGRAAAKAFGVRFLLRGSDYSLPAIYSSLISRHVDAIATGGYEPSLRPLLSRVRAAGIPLLSSGDDIAARRTLWVNQSDANAYAQSLADALAVQINRRGEYAIVDQPGQWPIANEWQQLAEAYIAKTYPAMKLDGAVEGSDVNGQPEPSSVEDFMAAHPNLKGFVAIVPRGAYAVVEAIMQAGKVGQVFSACNGGGDFAGPLPGYVRSGVAELVYASDPVKLGYLTVWAAHYLLTGHTFKPGAYQVGGPIGLVWYYAKHQELRLGLPLTITKANADHYAGTF